MALFHRHKWSNWVIVESFKGEYVWGGGDAFVLIQKRICEKCGKVELNRQIA